MIIIKSIMSNTPEEKTIIFNFSLASSTISIAIIIYLLFKFFYGIKTTTFATILTVFSIVVPLIKFLINYLFVNKLKYKTKNYIIIPLTNTVVLPITLAIELLAVLFIDGLLKENIIKLSFILIAFLLANGSTEIIFSPYLVEVFNKHKKVDLVKLSIISTGMVALEIYLLLLVLITYNHTVLSTFTFWELAVISILGGIIAFIILKKSFSLLYNDLKYIRKFISEGTDVKNTIISKNFKMIFDKVENIISLKQSSELHIVKSIESIQSNLNKIIENLTEMENDFINLKKFIKDLKTNSNKDSLTLKELYNNLKILTDKTENLIKQIKLTMETSEEATKLILEISPVLVYLKNELDSNENFLSSLFSNLKKAQEITVKLQSSLPEITNRYKSIITSVKNLSNLATKINFIRVSFDIELSKTEISKTSKERLSIISQKLDLLFKNISSITEKINIAEEKESLEESIKKLFYNINSMIDEVKALSQDIKTIKESLSKTFTTTSDLKTQINKIEENLRICLQTLKNSITNLKSNLYTSVYSNITSLSRIVKTISEIEEEVENFSYLLRDYIRKLKSSEILVQINIENV